MVGQDPQGWADGAAWRYPLGDALGSVRQVVDGGGAVLDDRSWTPFGVEEGTAQGGLGYTGEWWDGEVALLYLRARWYDPTVGRFTTEDPFTGVPAQPGTLNLYAYALNNPVIYTDPSGWCSGDSVIGLMAYGGSGPWPWEPLVAYEIRSGNPGVSPPNPELAKELSLNAAFLDTFAFGINLLGDTIVFALNVDNAGVILGGSSMGPEGTAIALVSVHAEVIATYAPFNAIGKFIDLSSMCMSSIADIAGGYTYIDATSSEIVLGQDLSTDLLLSFADSIWGEPIGDTGINIYSLISSWQSLSVDPTWETRVSIHGIRVVNYID